MRRLSAGLACFVVLVGLSGCASSDRRAVRSAGGGAATATTVAADPKAAAVKQPGAHLSGRNLNLAVYYLRSFKGRRYLAPEWHPVPYTRAVAAAAVGELLGGQPLCHGSRRPFPEGARLQAVTVEGGTATVDLAGSALDGKAGRWQQQEYEQQAQYAAAPPPPPAPVGGGGGDMTAELERLASLRNQGVLTDDEFAAAKAKLLGI